MLAVQAVAVREGKQLYELARLLQPPGRFRDRHAVDGGCKAPEKRHADIAHQAEHHLPSAIWQALDGPRRWARGDLDPRNRKSQMVTWAPLTSERDAYPRSRSLAASSYSASC